MTKKNPNYVKELWKLTAEKYTKAGFPKEVLDLLELAFYSGAVGVQHLLSQSIEDKNLTLHSQILSELNEYGKDKK